jgi:hypothetical protein
MMTNQDTYRLFAAKAPDLPLFMQPWFLDAVCDDGVWEVVLVEKAGRVVAVWPYFIKKKWFWRHIAMPRLCKFMGPYLLPEFRTLNDEMRLYEAMLEQLPNNLAAFQQDMNYTVTNWLPWYWRGFRQTTRYSYALSMEQSEEQIFQGFAKSYQKKIRKAREKLELRFDLPLAELQRLINLSFARQGLAPPLDNDFFQRFYDMLIANHCGQLFFIVDPATGLTNAAGLLAWDSTAAYLLATGADPALRTSGAQVLLDWETIRFTKNELKLPVYDFEGSMIRTIETGRRDYGAYQKQYFRIQHEWSALWKWGKTLVSYKL